jgi:hypothetical protein
MFFSLASNRTIKNNLRILKESNVIDYVLKGNRVENIKFNADYIPAIPHLISPIFEAALYNQKPTNSDTKVIENYEVINDLLLPITNLNNVRNSVHLNTELDFEEKQKERNEIGDKSEKIALEFEKNTFDTFRISESR